MKKSNEYKLQKRKDGRWSTRITIDGECLCLYAKTKSELQAKLKSKLEDIEMLQLTKSPCVFAAEKTSVREWAEFCLKTYSISNVRGSTYNTYLCILRNHFDGGLGDKKLSNVRNLDIQQHINRKARNRTNPDGLSEKSLNNIRLFINYIFNIAIKNGIIVKNPALGVIVPKTDKKETRALTVDEEHSILSAARKSNRYIMFTVVFALYTGCRKGEILGLKWSDVDFDEEIIHISHQLTRMYNKYENSETKTLIELSEPKTQASIRDIYMFKSFKAEFFKYKQKMIAWKEQNNFRHTEDDFVFVGQKNTSIEPRVFYSYYQEIMKEAKIENANFHTLRHTFATRCIENGIYILMVSRTLGHTNVKTTLDKYSHLLPVHQKLCMEKLEEIYF